MGVFCFHMADSTPLKLSSDFELDAHRESELWKRMSYLERIEFMAPIWRCAVLLVQRFRVDCLICTPCCCDAMLSVVQAG